MIDPIQLTLVQPADHFHTGLDILQLIATGFLGIVALDQARAAKEQARTAIKQADAAHTQAEAARSQLEQSRRPRLTPSRFEPNGTGGRLILQNVGQGTAYAVRWRFDREWHWHDAEDILSDGDHTIIQVLVELAERHLHIEYSSAAEEVFATKVDPATLTFSCIDQNSIPLVTKLRGKQQGR